MLGDSGFGRFEDSIPRKIRSDRLPFVGFESLKDSASGTCTNYDVSIAKLNNLE